MCKQIQILLVSLILLLILVGSAYSDTAYVENVTIEDVSTQWSGYGRQAVHTVDGSGWLINGAGTHTNLPNGTMWLTNTSQAVSAAYIVFDLGAEYDLESMDIWNSNGPSSEPGRGVKDMEVLVSADNSTWTSMGNYTLAIAPGDAYVPFTDTHSLAADGVRYVKFDIATNFDNNIYGLVGLSEVRFIPEPATLVLLGVGGLAFLRRQRS